MTNSARLSRLLDGLAAQYESTRLALRTRTQECRAIENEIAGLAAQDRARHLDADDLAARAATDAAWHRWLAQRRAALNISLARAMAGQALARDAASRAFGRRQATEKLLENQRRQERLDISRRAAHRGD